MRERYADRLLLKGLAHTVGLTTFQLIGLFKRVVRLTPHAYLIQLRLNEACRHIRAGRPLAEVALAVGFCDQSALNHRFRQSYGVTPMQLSRAVGHLGLNARRWPTDATRAAIFFAPTISRCMEANDCTNNSRGSVQSHLLCPRFSTSLSMATRSTASKFTISEQASANRSKLQPSHLITSPSFEPDSSPNERSNNTSAFCARSPAQGKINKASLSLRITRSPKRASR